MDGKVLMDTNIIIDFIRKRDKKIVLDKLTFEGFIPVISIITITELWAGQSIELEEQYLKVFLTGVEILSLNETIAKKAGEIIRESNYKVKFQDATVAATALMHKIPVLTWNYKDFADIKGLKVLTNKYARN